MKIEYKDFIGVFSEVYPEGFCEHLIAEFDRNQNLGVGTNRQISDKVFKHQKNDYQISSNCRNLSLAPFDASKQGIDDTDPLSIFFKGLQKCFEIYSNEFSVIKNSDIRCNFAKMQKTSPGGGYHVWHCEQGNGPEASRGLVYMLYLNTLPQEANGETEFLYQQRRINPVENTMVLWPAAFTHAHRGNPVYGDNEKYIITGWFYHE